jgi:hypothetical protein
MEPPKVFDRSPLKCNPAPPKLQTPFRLPTLESQMALIPQEKAKTHKTITASKPPLHHNLLGKLNPTITITPESQMACIL